MNFELFLTNFGIYPWYELGMNEYKEGRTFEDWIKSKENTQGCYKNFIESSFFDDSSECHDKFTNIHGKLLKKNEHLRFVRRMRKLKYPESSIEGESTRILMIYWSIHSEELLLNDYNKLSFDSEDHSKNEASSLNTEQIHLFEDSFEIIETILKFQNLSGGFGGNFSHIPNLVSTYLAVSSIIITGDTEALLKIDRLKMYQFFKQLRDFETGGFKVQLDGEVDVRAFYCVSAVASMLQIVTEELFDGIEEYILSCSGFDGGYSGDFGGESHGGYTYCVVSGLCILGKSSIVDVDSLLYWVVQRQSGIEGGFQGRTNKLVDSCYSFWFTGLLFCIGEILRIRGPNSESCIQSFFCDFQALISYILICCQSSEGGLIDKPKKPRDLYHTCYALSGLSLAQRMNLIYKAFNGQNPTSFVECQISDKKYVEKCISYTPFYSLIINEENLINPTDPFLNIRPDKIQKSRLILNKYPLVLTINGCIGTEGMGYKEYIENVGIS
ncbi:protein geranyl-geranyltransferase beta subunit [Cryptosporidium ubiquitum]|uniref:Protein farnesyltransferase subunit beta n=1 Tax=Cryptosporidium ubiquitum TaxID=857276 RepID=A0A1J4MK97_9CRYT|nr:protein geranyl-geranyltransferase beta subunit [Cryptosporidium ubiquitum]OII74640.1 protein geranyl-geranyltransferase beta subunit [Cryptosporidium ubiquitum]